MVLPRMNFQKKIASLDQESLSSCTHHRVQKSKYYHFHGLGPFEHLQKVAYEALREYTYTE